MSQTKLLFLALSIAVVGASKTVSATNTTSQAVCPGISAYECTIWQAFFDSTGGQDWTDCHRNRNDPCSCYAPGSGDRNGAIEVKCNNGHITGIDLHGRNLKGTIPASFGGLR